MSLISLPRSFYSRPTPEVARDLLGRYLVRELGGEKLVLRIVEIEAYLGAEDRASHAWGGRRTARNEAMYLAGGHAYVYFIYGMHFCLNVVTAAAGMPHALLLRAGEPIAGSERMAELRGLAALPPPGGLAGGPGRLCRAMGIDRGLDGAALWRAPLRLAHGEEVSDRVVIRAPRVGVDYAGEAAAWPLRFALRGNPHVSRPWPWRRPAT